MTLDQLIEYADGREIPEEAHRIVEQCTDPECVCETEVKMLVDVTGNEWQREARSCGDPTCPC